MKSPFTWAETPKSNSTSSIPLNVSTETMMPPTIDSPHRRTTNLE